MSVTIRDDNIDQAIHALKKETKASGILHEVSIRKYYQSRSQKRKAKDKSAAERRRMEKKANRFRRHDA